MPHWGSTTHCLLALHFNMIRSRDFNKRVTKCQAEKIIKWQAVNYNKKQRAHYKFWNPPADHLTKKFILNPVEGSRSAPTRSWNQNQLVMGWQWGQGPWKRSSYIQASDVLCYKPIPIIYRTLLLQNSLKVINVNDNLTMQDIRYIDCYLPKIVLHKPTS